LPTDKLKVYRYRLTMLQRIHKLQKLAKRMQLNKKKEEVQYEAKKLKKTLT